MTKTSNLIALSIDFKVKKNLSLKTIEFGEILIEIRDLLVCIDHPKKRVSKQYIFLSNFDVNELCTYE